MASKRPDVEDRDATRGRPDVLEPVDPVAADFPGPVDTPCQSRDPFDRFPDEHLQQHDVLIAAPRVLLAAAVFDRQDRVSAL